MSVKQCEANQQLCAGKVTKVSPGTPCGCVSRIGFMLDEDACDRRSHAKSRLLFMLFFIVTVSIEIFSDAPNTCM